MSFTRIIAPLVLFSMIPPVGPGRSLIVSTFCSPDWTTTLGLAGFPAIASDGTSADDPQKQPVQTGKSGSPCSNSIQTPEPICGTKYDPLCLPAIGTHGIAQVDGVSPDTSGTIAWMRPRCSGSMFWITVPRYFPKY